MRFGTNPRANQRAHKPGRKSLRLERLEPRHLLSSTPLISEFMASNDGTLNDGDGQSSDWIEIHNPTGATIDLAGWHLTDDAANLNKWTFPSQPQSMLEPGEYLVVFASGQETETYIDAGGNLHTDFKLSAGGEYLGLTDPAETIVHEYAPEYPPQFEDVSYGVGPSLNSEVLIASGADASVFVPTDDSVDDVWTDPAFDDSLWTMGPTGIGYEDTPQNYASLIATPVVQGATTAYIRMNFIVEDASEIESLTLRMKFDDGFVAYLNGEAISVASFNAPAEPDHQSLATANHSDSLAVEFVPFDLTDDLGLLQDGTNLLAIQVLNRSVGNSDLLLLPELIATAAGDGTESAAGFFLTATPGAENSAGISTPGPLIANVTENPPTLADEDDLVITAQITQVAAMVDTVTLHYRVMYGGEVTVAMVDDGTGADLVAGDGAYSALIPHTASGPGEMVRWYVTAQDIEGATSRAPAFLDSTGTGQSPEYFGTVIADPSASSNLPIIQTFLAPSTESAANTESGTRVSVSYNGEFYDNAFIRRRGKSTAGLPKKSYKLDFNKGDHFQFEPGGERVSEINLNSTWTDKTYGRQSLAFETYDLAGVPGSESSLVRVDRNGEFFQVSVYIEQPDADLLAREGLDPAGALYKNVGNDFHNASSFGGLEKKTRSHEGNADIQSLITNINTLSGAALKNYIFDNINIPEVLSYLSATVLVQNNDSMKKNYYLYRDSDGTGEWSLLPWDLDLTFGRHFMNGANTSENIWADLDRDVVGGANISPSHPFVGPQALPGNRSWNGLIDALYDVPEFLEMFRRRLRTVMDQVLQPPETPSGQLFYEAWYDQLAADLGNDHTLDQNAWGNFGGPSGSSLTAAIGKLEAEYLAVRRTHLFQTHHVDNVASYSVPGSFSAALPSAQSATPTLTIGAIDFNPASGNQDEEYIVIENPHADSVDISGWTVEGAIGHTFAPGTVITAGGSLYLTPSSSAFRARATGPSGGQGLLVQQWDSGHLSSFGETITIKRGDDSIAVSHTFVGDPSDQQQHLRITELHYNPVGPTPAEQTAGFTDGDQFEFIELVNTSATTLDLNGAHFNVMGGGVTFAFGVGDSLAAGERGVLVSDLAAFEQRYGQSINVLGVYTGNLSNGGEQIDLEDSTNSTVLKFNFEDGDDLGEEAWPTEPDGDGPSLVVIDTQGDYSDGANWMASSVAGGTPGADETPPLPGDYNADGSVDSVDYALWKSTFGSTSDLRADGNGNNIVDAMDYAIWRENLGQTATIATGAAPQAVPPPAPAVGPTLTPPPITWPFALTATPATASPTSGSPTALLDSSVQLDPPSSSLLELALPAPSEDLSALDLALEHLTQLDPDEPTHRVADFSARVADSKLPNTALNPTKDRLTQNS